MEQEDSSIVNPTPLFPTPPLRRMQPDEESGNSAEEIYTPEVTKNELIPKLKQEFKSLDDVYKFYNNYAFEAGFSVRMHSSKTDKNGEPIRKEYVCSKEGESQCSEVSERQRGQSREKCGARLTVVKNRSGEGFVVTQFVDGHSHSLTTPRKKHFLRSHRRVSLAQRVLTQQLAAANVTTIQEEIFQIGAYVLTILHDDEQRCVWKVHREEMEGSRGREVSVDKSSNRASCSCKMFEFDGIPCRHLLAYLNVLQIRELPSTYILQRWTKTVKAGRVFDDLGSHQKEICGSPILVRRQGIFELARKVVDYAVLDEEGTEIVRQGLLTSLQKVELMRGSRLHGSTSSIQLPISLGSKHGLKEPLKVRAKGCGKRLKGGKEKAVKKSRKCHGCGLLGQSHDKRNCPKLMNMSSEDVSLYDDDDDDDDDIDNE